MKKRKDYSPSGIPTRLKTTTKEGKKEYMKLYMRQRRHPNTELQKVCKRFKTLAGKIHNISE